MLVKAGDRVYEVDTEQHVVRLPAWCLCPRCEYEYEDEIETPIEEILNLADAIRNLLKGGK